LGKRTFRVSRSAFVVLEMKVRDTSRATAKNRRATRNVGQFSGAHESFNVSLGLGFHREKS
jgi:hypothetical protein